ncbi:MAG: class I SAM-dependent methyltransferase [Pseudanabaenaceae cyanobacterium SKYGB_i_bin29]|nr:class I SAM-dependent methyltransferase [Pseudanabaenaceae cyanobacterium SKYG29]MDW8420386.1 class I SAM-dependent methyltransferase [Pseudanabaenaceae cyanobacterium SKYGB_i_bin29]
MDIPTCEKLALTKVKSLTAARGELVFPCVPHLADHFFQQVHSLLLALGQNLKPQELESLRSTLHQRIQEGFQQSPHARLSFQYEPPDPTVGLTSGLRIRFSTQILTIEDKYARWVKTRQGPLFGSHPDAKVMAVVQELGQPPLRILDVGAGTGRNTLPLARLGHQVTAIELAPVFVQKLTESAQAEGLTIEVQLADILKTPLPANTYDLIIVVEVISHFRSLSQVRQLLENSSQALKPGGKILFSTFLTIDNFVPTPMMREVAEVAWSFLVTPGELQECLAGLPLAIESNESAYDYERTFLPPAAWPPTKWFINWATGRDVFPTTAEPPMSLRWILARRL